LENGPTKVRYALCVLRSGLKIGGFAFDGFTAEGRTITKPVDPDYPKANAGITSWVCDGETTKIYTDGKQRTALDQEGNFVDT
jgi:hypothetical protein